MPTLRSNLIRLASEHPELRTHLLPLLSKMARDPDESIQEVANPWDMLDCLVKTAGSVSERVLEIGEELERILPDFDLEEDMEDLMDWLKRSKSNLRDVNAIAKSFAVWKDAIRNPYHV